MSLPLAGAVVACGGEDGSAEQSSGDLGTAPAPENGIELVGRIDQEGPSFEGYGYVTHLSGAEDASLFAGSAEGGEPPAVEGSEDAARLTFSLATDLTTRAIHEPVFATASEGSIDFYFNEQPAGDFEDPESFAQGDEVASGTLRVHTIINVFAPNRGIATADGVFEQESATSFDLEGESHQLGHEGLEMRVFMTGQGELLNAELPRSVIDFSGNLTAAND
jgi:hypothetical protein